MKKVINGQPNYIKKVLMKMMNSGWRVTKSHSHPDGTFTYVLEI